MELINPTAFASAVASSPEQFAKIGKLVRKYKGDKEAELFHQACSDLNFKKALDTLDELMMLFSGCDNTTDALHQFVEKFPKLNPEMYDAFATKSSEDLQVLAIDHYYDQMKRIMEGK